jgi:RNA polymerase sigma-70 factor (ECF subfamily)
MSESGTGTASSSSRRFPTTHWTVIKNAADPSSPAYRASLEHLAATYWRPIYAYFRRKWNRPDPDAKDLTQQFFAALCEREFLRHLSPEHGRFRSYVMAALDNFVRLEYRAKSRLKRGGGAAPVALDAMEDFEPSSGEPPDQVFLKEWGRSILAEAVREMEKDYREAGEETAFRLFVARDLEAPPERVPSYEELARRFGMSVSDINNNLFRARKKLRDLVLIRVRDTVTSDEEAEAELRDLFQGGGPR